MQHDKGQARRAPRRRMATILQNPTGLGEYRGDRPSLSRLAGTGAMVGRGGFRSVAQFFLCFSGSQVIDQQ
jgi:hypothetical protein